MELRSRIYLLLSTPGGRMRTARRLLLFAVVGPMRSTAHHPTTRFPIFLPGKQTIRCCSSHFQPYGS